MPTDRKSEGKSSSHLPGGDVPEDREYDNPDESPAWRNGATGWWSTPLCLLAVIAIAAIILIQFDLDLWTAVLLVILLFCPLVLIWGVIQSVRRAPLVVGPAPVTHGVKIDWLVPVYDSMCWVMGMGLTLRRRTIALADLKQGERVLDVGCGTGVLTRLAAEAVGSEGLAIGIDPGPAMIGVARLKAVRSKSRARFELGVIERIEFGDGSFDVVLSSFMLHHLPSDLKRAGLREVWRVLRPGGRFILVDFDRARPIGRAMLVVFGFLPAYASVLRAAGDPLSLLGKTGFTDMAKVGGWRGAATFWVARKPVG